MTGIWRVGGKEPAAHAQSVMQSAENILVRVARNERLVLGDSHDVQSAIKAFNSATAKTMDDYLLDMAGRRRKGELAM